MELIPCKVNKCISYPICITKEDVSCKQLYNFIDTADLNSHDIYTQFWRQFISKSLPHSRKIRDINAYTYYGRPQF